MKRWMLGMFWLVSFCVLAAGVLLFQGEIALAQTAGGDPFAKATSTVEVVVEGLRGGVARAILTLALVVMGILSFTGRIRWAVFASLAVGAILIVTAGEIANLILR